MIFDVGFFLFLYEFGSLWVTGERTSVVFYLAAGSTDTGTGTVSCTRTRFSRGGRERKGGLRSTTSR